MTKKKLPRKLKKGTPFKKKVIQRDIGERTGVSEFITPGDPVKTVNQLE